MFRLWTTDAVEIFPASRFGGQAGENGYVSFAQPGRCSRGFSCVAMFVLFCFLPFRLAAGGKLIVFQAASLSLPFAELEKRFEARNPGWDVVRESSSSRLAIRKVVDLGRPCDILATADEALLHDLVLPDNAKWLGMFARNRVVIAFTEKSKYRSEINADNWYEILLRKDVNFGYADPNMAPVGYRTHLCWKLADIYYAERLKGRSLYNELRQHCPDQFIRPHCNELIPLLESLTLDYTFQYQSVAMQHRLSWLKLPDEIDLGNRNLNPFYAQVSENIRGQSRTTSDFSRTGQAVVYGITIPDNAENVKQAEDFLRLLFSEEGQQIMTDNFQEPVVPPLCIGIDQAPESLKPILKEVDKP